MGRDQDTAKVVDLFLDMRLSSYLTSCTIDGKIYDDSELLKQALDEFYAAYGDYPTFRLVVMHWSIEQANLVDKFRFYRLAIEVFRKYPDIVCVLDVSGTVYTTADISKLQDAFYSLKYQIL